MESSQFQDILHHRSNSVKYLVDRRIAHEGAGGDQFILLVHVALADALAHVFAAQLVDGCCSVSGVRISRKEAPNTF